MTLGDANGEPKMRFIMALILLMIVFGASAQNKEKDAEQVAK
jgi:outer membrane lipoprotein-sorting protein